MQRSLSLGKRHRTEILDIVLNKLPLKSVVERLLPRTPDAVLDVVRSRFLGESHFTERKLLIAEAVALMNAENSGYSEANRLYWSGVAERLDGRLEEAIKLFRAAVDHEPDRVEWRLELAQTYRSAGRLDNALEEVRSCLRLAPKQASIEALRSELVRERLTTPDPKHSR